MRRCSRNRDPAKLRNRAGAAIVLMLVLLVVILGMVAFAVDVGLMTLLRAEIQNAVDAGAVAGALQLRDDPEDIATAEAAARQYVQLNRVGLTALVAAELIDVERGFFDQVANSFTPTETAPNAIRVFARQDNQPFYFARVFGNDSFGAPAEAIASSDPMPLDIMMVLDLTASMANQGRIEALHEAAPVFVQVIEQLDGEDQIGMMGMTADPSTYDPVASGHSGTAYNSGLHPSSDYSVAVLEAALDTDLTYLKQTALSVGQLPAGKYMGGTGIGAAIGDATHYLNDGAEARSNSRKIIVLMTDGEANRPSDNAPGYALSMASYADSLDVTIYTISLGNSADVVLNQDIAQLTGGIHFDATGSGQVALTTRLSDAFRQAASAAKRVKLVH